MKTYKLILPGFGNVGQALAHLLLEKRSELEHPHHRLRPAGRSAAPKNWHCTYTRRVLENGKLIREKTWKETIPRHHH